MQWSQGGAGPGPGGKLCLRGRLFQCWNSASHRLQSSWQAVSSSARLYPTATVSVVRASCCRPRFACRASCLGSWPGFRTAPPAAGKPLWLIHPGGTLQPIRPLMKHRWRLCCSQRAYRPRSGARTHAPGPPHHQQPHFVVMTPAESARLQRHHLGRSAPACTWAHHSTVHKVALWRVEGGSEGPNQCMDGSSRSPDQPAGARQAPPAQELMAPASDAQ